VSWREWKENPAPKILSFLVAAGLWFSVTNRLDFEDNVEIPVEYMNLPESLATIEPLPGKVMAHVHGKGKFLRYTLRDAVCRVDLGGYQIGENRITLSGEDVMVPEGVVVNRVEVLEPRRVTVEFDEVMVREVPVVATVVGNPDPRYVQVGRTFVDPARARLRGPRKLVEKITLVQTRELDLAGKRSSLRRTVRLVSPDSPTVELTPAEVDVMITVEPITSRRIDRVPLRVADGGSRAKFFPSTLAVELEGPRTVVDLAAKDSLVLTLRSEGWQSGGQTMLRVKEIRGSEIVLAPVESFPDSLLGAGDREGEEGPPAVTGEVVARLRLSPDVEILELEPDRVIVYFGATPAGARGRR
jgi:hypothetical protein